MSSAFNKIKKRTEFRYAKNVCLRHTFDYAKIASGKQKQGGSPFIFQKHLRKKGGGVMVTYAELIQFCILLTTLVSLFYEIYKDKK